ncbi:MAG: GNAT family N-acetyltransferase [Candidatus Saccharibacteria bacterium]|nr:GNAT family N-acetyltransferase [Candidatus Saccharibacteria bacterium]
MGKENQIEIRNLTADDVLGVAQIKINSWKETYKEIIKDEFLDSLSVETQAQQFAKLVGSDNFIVAILNGEVVGFCRFIYDNSLSPNIDYADCELAAIYVRPDLKGQGIGTKMFKEAMKRFKDQNKTTMILWCLADNVNSVEFYKHMGGEIKEERMVGVGDKQYKEVGIVYDV